MKYFALAVASFALAGSLVSPRAHAQAPGLLYTPGPNQVGVEVVMTATENPGIAEGSIVISEDPGAPGDGGATPASLTTVFCTIGGDPGIEFASIPSFGFQGSVPGGSSVDLSCTQDPTLITTAVINCFEKRGGVSQPDKAWDVQCPSAGTAAAPEIDVVPPAGSTLQMSSTSPSDASAQFTVFNTGSATLNVSSITGLAAPFSVAPPNANITAGGNQAFTVTCNGGTPGVFFDALTVNSNDGDEAAINYQVDCTINAVAGQEYESVPAPPGPIDLANTAGAPATTATITITNAGSGTLNISNLSALSLPLSRSIGSTSLGAGASTDITIGCQSAGATSTSQNLTFNTDDPDDGEGSISFGVNCNVNAAAAPEFASAPGTPGPVTINTSTSVLGQSQVFVQNIGSASLSISLGTAPTAPVTVTGLPLNLTSGSGAVALNVDCLSASAGTFNRSFTLTTNDASEGSVPFNVNCTVVAGAAPEFDSTPASPGPLTITTNQGVVGSANVTLRNLGNSTLTISNIGASSGTFSALPAAPINIAPGAQSNLSVRCLNNTPGDYTGTITLTTNDASEGSVPFTVNCRVNLVAPEYGSTPNAGSTFAFYVKPTEVIQVIVRISNTGNAPLTYSLSGLSGPLSSSPAIGGPYNLNAGASQNIVVSCNGAALAGTVVQNLSITHNDTGESPALYRIDCRPDIRLDATSVLRAILGTPLLTDDSVLLLENGFE